MTIKEYLNLPQIELKTEKNKLTPSLNQQYESLKDRFKVFFYKKDTNIIYLVKVPSRRANSILYDVVIEVNIDTSDSTINNLEFKCFSNCPSFTFTFANVFKKKGFLCSWLNDKYDSKIFTNDPNETNPDKQIRQERSLYLALKHLTSTGRSSINNAKLLATNVTSYNQIKNYISNQKNIDNIDTKKKSINKKIPEKPKMEIVATKRNEKSGHSSGIVKHTKNTNKTDSINKDNKTKKTKKF